MPDSLQSNSPLLIALIGLAGTVVVSFFGYLGSRRDKATANTITELRTIIERLGFDLDRSRERQAESESDAERADEAAQSEKDRAASLEAEIARLSEVRAFKHWLYIPSDDSPRVPVCHVCYSRYGSIRMREEVTEYFTAHKDVDTTPTIAYHCDNCGKHFDVDPRQAKELQRLLASEGDPD